MPRRDQLCRRRLRMPHDGTDRLWWDVRQHAEQCASLRDVQQRMCYGPSVHRRELPMPSSFATSVCRRLYQHDDRQQQLWRLRDRLWGLASVRRGYVPVRGSLGDVWRIVRQHRDGFGQLRRVQSRVWGHTNVSGRCLCVPHGTARLRRKWNLPQPEQQHQQLWCVWPGVSGRSQCHGDLCGRKLRHSVLAKLCRLRWQRGERLRG